ncbi:MAG: AzlD domain-containing protein [Eubacteriaceae bacterium]|nr:AzlD domain-containing protein [Eubacteriaceae bacterium]
MVENYLLTVAGMTFVTYLPRALPLVLFKNVQIPDKLDKFLSLIPFTMLSALIFPSIFGSTGNVYSALGALTVCVFASYRKLNPTLIVLLGISTVYILQQF